ncbi:MAG: MBL fold metallo-hydrolase [Vicinamibacterales bacterium]|jgi:metallo-beta-lactamase class B|nr:MBL fold metallo-hydrolase [Vicinamibacterales bacterium]
MVKRLTVAAALSVALGSGVTISQSPAEVERHVAAAKVAAGSDHGALFDRICAEAQAIGNPRRGRGGAGRRGGPRPTPPRESWHAEPVQVFDNLYFLGMTEYSAWAVTTSDGIILIDAIFDYSIEDEVVDGLTALGLDPADIKYVVISHAHLDHAGGAKYLQERYGAQVVMAAADYDLLDRQNPTWKPARDIVATDGHKLTLGDTTVTLYLTPGHTEGTISTLVPVRDRGRSHLAAAWGGTAFNFGPNRDRLGMYIDSAARFRDIVEQAGADVLIANHTNFDGSKTKLPALAARQPGDPHPYVIGTDTVARYLTVAHECAQAALAGL